MENIYIKNENKHFPSIVRFSEHESLLDFGFKRQTKNFLKSIKINVKSYIKSMMW